LPGDGPRRSLCPRRGVERRPGAVSRRTIGFGPSRYGAREGVALGGEIPDVHLARHRLPGDENSVRSLVTHEVHEAIEAHEENPNLPSRASMTSRASCTGPAFTSFNDFTSFMHKARLHELQ